MLKYVFPLTLDCVSSHYNRVGSNLFGYTKFWLIVIRDNNRSDWSIKDYNLVYLKSGHVRPI